MLIGELADTVGLPSQTIRFYERRGLLPEPVRGANGYRIYDESTLTRLNFIHTAQAAGLTLAEIGSIIDLRDDGNVPCTHVASLLDSKLAAVRTRIRSLARDCGTDVVRQRESFGTVALAENRQLAAAPVDVVQPKAGDLPGA